MAIFVDKKSFTLIVVSISRKNMEQTYTIRDIVRKQIIPVKNASTIHTWMAENTFRPFIYESGPVGPGRGCQLNFADMVTGGLLTSMFAVGVKFNMLKFQGAEIPSAIVTFQRPIKGAPVKNSVGGRMPAHTWIADTPAKSIGPGREIQRFLEEFNYKVWVCISKSRIVSSPNSKSVSVGEGKPTTMVISNISFFPATKAFTEEYLDRVGAVMPWESTSFINAQHWASRVKYGMK